MNDEPRIKAEITRVYRAIQVSPEVFEKGELLNYSSVEYDRDGNELSENQEAPHNYEDTPVQQEPIDVVRDYDENGKIVRELFTYPSEVKTREFNANGQMVYFEAKDAEFHLIHKFTYDTDGKHTASFTYKKRKDDKYGSYEFTEYIHLTDRNLHVNHYECEADSVEEFLKGNFTKWICLVEKHTSEGEIIQKDKVVKTINFYHNDRLDMRVTTTETYPDRDMLLVERIEHDYQYCEGDEWVITEEEIVYWEES